MVHSLEIISITKDIPDTVYSLLKDTDWLSDSMQTEDFKNLSKAIITALVEGLVV